MDNPNQNFYSRNYNRSKKYVHIYARFEYLAIIVNVNSIEILILLWRSAHDLLYESTFCVAYVHLFV